LRHDADFYENSGAITTQPQHKRGCLWAMTCRQDNDTPLQPQSERSKRRRQWVGLRQTVGGVKFPWSCASSHPLLCLSHWTINHHIMEIGETFISDVVFSCPERGNYDDYKQRIGGYE